MLEIVIRCLDVGVAGVHDARAESTWKRLDAALDYYTRYLANKPNNARFSLSVVDLVYVRNFKAGNSSITESLGSLERRLPEYRKVLAAIDQAFSRTGLGDLATKELSKLIALANATLQLARAPATAIRGFGPSYASAMLAAHFPQLLPVLDRRVLNGAGIAVKFNSQKQVVNIESYYGALIQKARRTLREEPGLTLRALDRRWFVVPLN